MFLKAFENDEKEDVVDVEAEVKRIEDAEFGNPV
jgi:hypothetical protein